MHTLYSAQFGPNHRAHYPHSQCEHLSAQETLHHICCPGIAGIPELLPFPLLVCAPVFYPIRQSGLLEGKLYQCLVCAYTKTKCAKYVLGPALQ